MAVSRGMELDPITFEVVTSSYRTITELMGDTFKRVSRSPIIYDSVDFSNGLLDDRCQLFAQANNSPVHLGSLHFGTRSPITASVHVAKTWSLRRRSRI
jgi:N-methylhydantoinase B/oxoprolinase/acetone carboxylase alpha subunit